MAPVDGSPFRPRVSKRFENGEALAPKRSFHNLRQLFKLPARVLTPLSNNHVERRSREPSMGNPIPILEPKTHRLLGPISPTRERGIPSNSNTSLPNLRVPSSRNASRVFPPAGRNISLPEPLPSPRLAQLNYLRPTQSGLRSSHTMNLGTSQDISYSLVQEAQPLPVSTSRRVFTDITRRINSPQLNFPRLSLGPRSTSIISLPYPSGPTTSTCQETSPPRPIFTNSTRPTRRAERSLSMLNQEITPPNAYLDGKPRSISTRNSLATTHSFATTVSSLLQAAEPTTAPTDPATPPKAVFTTNPRCIYTSQPHSYWAGRFTSLHDQYHSQMLLSTINDEKLLQSFVRPSNHATKIRKKNANSENMIHAQTIETPNLAMENDEVRRCKRVFYTLQSLCVTVEAKRSLWGFQLRFARERRMEACLPDGGTMEPETVRTWTRFSNRRRSMTADSLGETF
jgi:hypothetical protein